MLCENLGSFEKGKHFCFAREQTRQGKTELESLFSLTG